MVLRLGDTDSNLRDFQEKIKFGKTRIFVVPEQKIRVTKQFK